MKRIVFVYDNIGKPIDKITSVIGGKSFAEIVVKRKSLRDICMDSLRDIEQISDIIMLNSTAELDVFKEKVEYGFLSGMAVFHYFSNFIFQSKEAFSILVSKLSYSLENTKEKSANSAFLYFENSDDYLKYLSSYIKGDRSSEHFDFIELQNNTINFINLNSYQDFLRYLSGGFDTRFFNSIMGDDLFITKKSVNRKKIEMEYRYYYLIPDKMKTWMVMPFDYKIDADTASYTMERLKMSDIAIRWIHEAVSLTEMDNILNKLFSYIQGRARKKVGKDEYIKTGNALYLDKLRSRVDEVKRHKLFDKYEAFISKATYYNTIDEIVNKYENLYNSIKFKDFIQVIGHGDLCFSNILYSDEISMIKLIDPKGAIAEDELWTDPYYDIAKLSHSICGRYDFFNAGKYDIVLNNELKFELRIFFDNQQYIDIFKTYLIKFGYDYKIVRILEASLFLSMMPLHMDYPNKVFGFLLNAINILEEVSNV